ncbi:MAG: hypothetical protein HRU72_03225 [Planctomycetia bacterium]|nr:MAG: hypothetical protein HRU72_03225 [Planctomycetia bacterium]
MKDKTWTNKVCPCHPEARVCIGFSCVEMVRRELVRRRKKSCSAVDEMNL